MRIHVNFFAVTFLLLCHFFAKAQPIISGFAPTSGIAGSSVVISGTNFSSTASDNTVFFGAVQATVVSATGTSINVLVPAGANYEPITVTIQGLTAASTNAFNVLFSGGGDLNSTSFDNRQNFTTGLNPNDVVLADIDLDGKPDVITANNMSVSGFGSISVLRNTSIGDAITFANKIDFVNGAQTYALAAADLDGDGKQDIVATSIGEVNISVFRNTSSPGNISFASRISYAGGNSPYSVAIADMDNDGKPDIIVVNATNNTISVFRNTSTPAAISFDPRINFATGLFPQSVAARDLDGDGKIDLAVTNKFSNNFSVYRNTGSAGNISLAASIDFTNGSGNQPQGIEIADITGDGKPEIIVMISANGSGNTGFAQVFKNNSSVGNFIFPQQSSVTGSSFANAYHINSGDVNGDGKPDLAMGVTGQDFVKVFQNKYNTGTGFFDFSITQQYGCPGSYPVAIGDLNGDGKPEIVSSFFNASSIAVFKNRCGLPGITDFSPTAGGAGVAITINGNNLSTINAVSFGGVPAASFVINNNQRITATLANGATGDVLLSGTNGSISAPGFFYYAPPTISSFTPVSGPAGTVVTINGQNLITTSDVSFGVTPATTFSASNTQVQATVGTGSTGSITLIAAGGTVQAPGFTFIPAPLVSSFSPTSGANGTVVTITGNNFTNATEVKFGVTPAASFIVLSPTSIQATVLGGSSGSVRVTTPGGFATRTGFTFIPPATPSITSFTPLSGAPGTVVTLTGNNFSANPLLNTVYVGAVQAQVISASITQLTFAVPVNATHGNISVTTNYLTAISHPMFLPTFAGSSTLDINSFEAPSFVSNPFGNLNIIIADIDNDGKGDLVTSGNIFRNTSAANGSISFAGPYSLMLLGRIAVADLDADGKKDIMAADGFYLNITKNISTPGNIQTTLQPLIYLVDDVLQFSVADFNKDGKPDLVFACTNGKVLFLRNTSTVNYISFAAPVTINVGTANFSVAVADFDGDDKADVAVLDVIVKTIRFLRNTSAVNGTFSFILEPTSYPTRVDVPNAGGAYHITADDLDGDGKADVVVSNSQASPTVSVLKNSSSAGAISFLPRLDFSIGFGGAVRCKTADLNGDAKPDILYADGATGEIIGFMKNTSAVNNINFAPNISISQGVNQSLYDVEAGDLNGDGKPDIVATNTNTKILVYRNLVSPPGACIGQPFSFTTNNVTGTSYQWQEDTGTGYTNLQNNSIYSGVNTITLNISNVASQYGTKYRCLTDGNPGNENLLKLVNQWTGAVNNAWENAGNWSCGSVPDANTDVLIAGGTVNISVSTAVASLFLSGGAVVNVAPGVNLSILH